MCNSIEEITHLVTQLDDKYDIFNQINETTKEKLNHLLIGLKFKSEYGTGIEIFDLNGKNFIKLFVNHYREEEYIENDFYLSSFTYLGQGLSEKIYSNRTEYFFNGEYLPTANRVIHLLRKLNQSLIVNKYYPELYDFIISKDEVRFIKKERLSKPFTFI